MPVKIGNTEYNTVAERIHAIHNSNPNTSCSIETEILSPFGTGIVSDEILVKATLTIKRDGETHTFTGHAYGKRLPYDDKRRRQDVNTTSFIENAETSAVGRALAFAGLGGTNIASADEVEGAVAAEKQMEQDNIADRARVEAMNVAFKSYEKVEDELTDMGLSKDIFWKEFARHTQATDRETVTIQQWKQLNVDLISGSFGDWIFDAVSRLAREQQERGESGEMSPDLRHMLDAPPSDD